MYLFFLFAILISILVVNLYYTIATNTLKKWVIENGYILIKKETRFLRRGPCHSTSMQVVYKVVLKKNKNEKEFWIKVGHPIFGLFMNKIEIEN